jgi:LysM repeat protein
MVQSGDTLSALSRRFGVPAPDLARANGLAPDAGLLTGQALSLPSGTWSNRLAIRAIQPEAGTRVRAPIVVRGTAAVFENQIVVEALDASGTRLAQVSAKAASPDTGQHGPFEATLAIPSSSTDRPVTIRLYWPSPRDGSPTDEIRIRVTVAA